MNNALTRKALSVIAQAETNHGFISVVGYVTEDGKIANYTLQPLGEYGYHKIVKEAIEMEIENPKFSKETWEKALASQRASWQKTLDGGHGKKDNFQKVDKGFYLKDGYIYIRNVIVIKSKTIQEGEYKPKKFKNDFFEAKDYIRRQAKRLKKYRATFKIAEGKFQDIKFKHELIEA
jgi:hypothetical protein